MPIQSMAYGLSRKRHNRPMNLISDMAFGILRFVTKLALLAFAAVFAVIVVLSALVLIAVALIRFLLTGRKPAVVATFSRVRQGAQQFRSGAWSAGGFSGNHRNGDADIVDVEAREVHETRTVLSVPMAPKIPE